MEVRLDNLIERSRTQRKILRKILNQLNKKQGDAEGGENSGK